VDYRAERRTDAAADLERAKQELAQSEEAHGPKLQRLEAELAAEIQRLRDAHAARVQEVTLAIESKRNGVAALEAKLSGAPVLPEKVDTASLQAKIDQGQSLNREFERRAEQAEINRRATAIEAEAQALTAAMEKREAEKLKALQGAQMPVDGLSLSGGSVLFNGLPFDQASDAEALRVSVAIAMAANPKLRVIRVRDGSLLDEDGMTLLSDLARQKDYQIWCERVDSTGKIGIVMDDGEVVADCQVPAETA
jgi:hypothetical protein